MQRPPRTNDETTQPAATATREHTYSIGVASRLANLPVETVRIWERRYALLQPARSKGGHRFYSDDDVALLRAARALVDAGWRPGSIFRLGRERVMAEAARLGTTPQPEWGDVIDAVIDAGVALDEARVAALLDGPLVQRSVDDVVAGLWLPVMRRVGELWEEGTLTVAVEHFLLHLVGGRVQSALRAATSSSTGPLALCACAPDERHEVGLFAAALALKRAGHGVVVFGGDMPVKALKEAAERLKPQLLVLSTTTALSKAAAQELPAALSQPPLSSLPLLLGGYSAPQLSALLSRPHRVVDDIGDVAAAARALLDG